MAICSCTCLVSRQSIVKGKLYTVREADSHYVCTVEFGIFGPGFSKTQFEHFDISNLTPLEWVFYSI